MLLSITTNHRPALDLGYLLHKHPERFQSFDLSFGKAHVFYPEAGLERCTACLLLDVDPVGMVRGKNSDQNSLLAQYVNDRPYAVSAIARRDGDFRRCEITNGVYCGSRHFHRLARRRQIDVLPGTFLCDAPAHQLGHAQHAEPGGAFPATMHRDAAAFCRGQHELAKRSLLGDGEVVAILSCL